MAVKTAAACQLKVSLFGVCAGDKVAACQYCGRSFCSRHGVVLQDGQGDRQEICSRKECIAKRQDLERHLMYRRRVGVRNEAGSCGIDSCSAELGAECVRCTGLFCGRHVRRRGETIYENKVKVPRLANLCQHCWERRPIWLKQ